MRLAHEERVAAVARQIVSRPPGSKLTIRKSTPSHSVRDPRYKHGLQAIDVSSLTEILAIDRERLTVTAEGQVTMGEPAKATLAEGFLAAVVPEFRKFTVSGLINGEGIQSSSHRYGVFSHTLLAIEILTARGELVTATPDQHPDLFAALPESLGTLGIVVSATLRLVPAKPMVALTYRRFESLDDYVKAFVDALGRSDFHEGVIYGPRCHVLLTGDFADDAGGLPVFNVERPGESYYFQHVRSLAIANRESREAMTTLSYLARGERGLWWTLEGHADFPLLSETEWGRKQLDAAATAAYEKGGFASQGLTTEERDRSVINQDMGVRIERLAEGIRWIQQHLQVYPLWNCAIQLPDKARALFRGSTHLVDLGIYGEPKTPDYRRVRDMRAVQQMADAPSLWGVSFLSWEELSASIPGRFERYERARRQVHADEAFLHIRDKVVWVDPATPDPGKIPMWRLRQTYGARWFLNPIAYLVLSVAAISKLVWRNKALG